jgi:hypothetical protein
MIISSGTNRVAPRLICKGIQMRTAQRLIIGVLLLFSAAITMAQQCTPGQATNRTRTGFWNSVTMLWGDWVYSNDQAWRLDQACKINVSRANEIGHLSISAPPDTYTGTGYTQSWINCSIHMDGVQNGQQEHGLSVTGQEYGEVSVCPLPPPCPRGVTRAPDGMCPVKQCQSCPQFGNPVQPALANKFQNELDYKSSSALAFSRTYNSVAVRSSTLGGQWRHSFDRAILIQQTSPTLTVDVVRPDGSSIRFVQSGAQMQADADVSDRLERITDVSGATVGWEYRVAADDRLESFEAGGLGFPDFRGQPPKLTRLVVRTPLG